MRYEIRYPLIVFAVVVSASLFIGCSNKAAQQPFQRPPAPVSVSTAVAQDVPTYLDAVGKTAAREVVSIQPQVSGRIVKLHFTDGANVRKGDMLFTIDPAPFEAALRQAQANVQKDVALKKQAESNLASEIAKANWGKVQVNRYKTLVEQGVVSREQYEELRATQNSLDANVGSARAAVNSAEESIKVDTAAVETAKLELSYCSIRSPIDGRAGQRLVDVGNIVHPGSSSASNAPGSGAPATENTLLVIERLDPIYADFTISQNRLSEVQTQMKANRLTTEVRLPDEPDSPVIGQLTFLNNAVEDATGTVGLRATIPNSAHRFWPGRFVNIRLVLNTIHQAVLVPSTAPQMSANGSFVYVVKQDSTAEQRPVTLGQRQGDLIVVESGVSAGERVVTVGQLGVTPNGKVHIQEKPTTAAASTEAK
ncbi:MAG TPA: efflux RND transporter periplasmic adaptor subunit [Pyrinomonadaceae bacterium]|jgi:multidrug efflux system membrane fusion protein